jgi:hypothetical protein
MNFRIEKIITGESEIGDFGIEDLMDLEEFINVNIEDRQYGRSVTSFLWGFELFKFNGDLALFLKNEVAIWQSTKKCFVSNSHFDWNKFAGLTKVEALKLIKKECLNSIKRADLMKGKPKDFNTKLFIGEMKQVFDHYIKHNVA